MTFLEWCMKNPEDNRDLHIVTSDGQVFEPGEVYLMTQVNELKPRKIIGHPKLINNIWQIRLQ